MEKINLRKYSTPSNPFLRTNQTGAQLEAPAFWTPLSTPMLGGTILREMFNSPMQPLDFSSHADHAYSVQDTMSSPVHKPTPSPLQRFKDPAENSNPVPFHGPTPSPEQNLNVSLTGDHTIKLATSSCSEVGGLWDRNPHQET